MCVDDGVTGACTALGCAEPSVLCNPDPAPEMLYVMKGERSSAILDLHHDSASDTGLRFEDVNWRRHLSSLKPVGLTCLLGARDASTNAGTMASRRRSHGGPPRRRHSNGNQGTATTAIAAAAAAGAEADTGTGTPAASGAVVGFPRRRRSFHTDSGVVGGDGVASSRRRLRSNSTTPALLASTRTAPLPRSHPSATTLLPPRRRGGSSYDTSPVLTAVTEGDAVATLALGNSNVQGQSSPARGYAFPVLVLVFHTRVRTYVTCPRGMCVCVCCVCAGEASSWIAVLRQRAVFPPCAELVPSRIASLGISPSCGLAEYAGWLAAASGLSSLSSRVRSCSLCVIDCAGEFGECI